VVAHWAHEVASAQGGRLCGHSPQVKVKVKKNTNMQTATLLIIHHYTGPKRLNS